MSKGWQGLLDLLFPPKCPFCRRMLNTGDELLCPHCQQNLPWTRETRGEQRVEFAARCVAPLWYQDDCREAVHRFKFDGVRRYSQPFAVLMTQCAQDRLTGSFDLVTWVPISALRRWGRGYDQSQLLARGVAQGQDLPLVQTMKKKRHNKRQSKLVGRAARRANVLGVYKMVEDVSVRDKRVLLIDDVVTTGATLSECARVLRTAGAREVVCLALAMTGQESKKV